METDQPPRLNPPQTSGMAVASLITGMIGVAPLAIIFGHIAMSQIRKSAGQLTGFGLALAGTILGYVGLAVIILLFAISILFVGARAWKKGSDRAACILNIRNVQQAVRSYQGMKEKNFGDPIDWSGIIGPGKMMEREPMCPAGGTYTFSKVHPELGKLACTCNHAEHVPPDHHGW